MKKNALIALGMLMLSVFSLTFTSCGDDDDEPVLTTPKYAENSVLYKINGASDISSVEFTEAGMYIITKKTSDSAAKGFFQKGKSRSSFTRSDNDDYKYIYGKYTKDGDVYTLEGFGTITVVKKESVNVSLQIQPTGEEAYTLSAQPAEKFEKSDISTKLCRTWKYERGNMVCTKGDSLILEKTSTSLSVLYETLDSLFGERPDEYNNPEEVIFTLSGSYIVKYDDGTLAVAQWKWKNEKEGVSYFTWGPEWEEKDVFAISFNEKNELVVDDIWCHRVFWLYVYVLFTYVFLLINKVNLGYVKKKVYLCTINIKRHAYNNLTHNHKRLWYFNAGKRSIY